MKKLKRITKKSINSYRNRGILKFFKNNFNYYIKNLTSKSIRRKDLKIFYVDRFTFENSNFYWLGAFRNFGNVNIFDINRKSLGSFKKEILKFNPDHVHLGSSVKDDAISPQTLIDIKERLNCSISAFYGDVSYSTYHFELAKIIDFVYLSNKTHIRINREKGLDNFRYMICPTYPPVFNHQKVRKRYDVVFIGNNNRSDRLDLLKKISEKCNLKVFGNKWEDTELNYNSPVYGKKFSRVCSQAKICLGEKEPDCTKLEACFSNRLVNTLATRSFYINPYTQGLEDVFTNKKHLIWYKNREELFELINYYLKHSSEREEIARQGQKEVYSKYTYSKSVKRILEDVGVKLKN